VNQAAGGQLRGSMKSLEFIFAPFVPTTVLIAQTGTRRIAGTGFGPSGAAVLNAAIYGI
jgi:hypothetical protein